MLRVKRPMPDRRKQWRQFSSAWKNGRSGCGHIKVMADEIRIARPMVTVAGQDEPSLSEGLLSLLFVENTSGLYRCEALFGNLGATDGAVGFLYFDRRKLDFGKAFQIKIGGDTIFDGRIMGLEACFPEGGPPKFRLLAEDRFQDLRMTRRTRTFTDMDDAAVFRQVANELGLTRHMDSSGRSHKGLAQVNQSDLAFLRERAREEKQGRSD